MGGKDVAPLHKAAPITGPACFEYMGFADALRSSRIHKREFAAVKLHRCPGNSHA